VIEVPVHQRRFGISAPCGFPGKFEDPAQTISLILTLSKVSNILFQFNSHTKSKFSSQQVPREHSQLRRKHQ
jgi:hypothetical protein